MDRVALTKGQTGLNSNLTENDGITAQSCSEALLNLRSADYLISVATT